MKILISGSLAYDRIMDFPGHFEDHILPDKIHILNVCFTVNGLTEKFGGTAGNIAYSLALLGEQPVILAAAGKDFDAYRQWLIRHDLPLEGIVGIPDELTASAYITTDKRDNQITGFNPGAMKYPSGYALDGLGAGDALAIISPGNLEDMVDYARKYKKAGIAYICDPGPSIPALSAARMEEMLTGCAVLISNDYELEMIQKKTALGPEDLIERVGSLITTLGGEGAEIRRRDEQIRIPAVPVSQVKDPTGAGDAFRAGLIKGMVDGKDLADAARIGATCAAYAVEQLGTQEHRFSPEQFWERHRRAFA
jgi:adenosine kinase